MGTSERLKFDPKKPTFRLLIASVLKPIDDPRTLHRMAQTLSQANKYDLHIIGFTSKKPPSFPFIAFHPLFNFHRLSWQRLVAPLRFLRKSIQLKPKIIIVNTHELLLVTLINRIIFGQKIIYDVQENYYRNILYTDTFPKLIRWPLAIYVRTIEWVSKAWVSHYFLAENGYQKEFSFHKPNFTVLENKYAGKAKFISIQRPDSRLRLVYTGTIAAHYGIFEAINFVKLISTKHSVTFKIIGYCPKATTLKEVKEAIHDVENIEMVGGDEYVPHESILKAIQEADFGLVPYPKHPATVNCMPTRVFEYGANQLPMIFPTNSPWSNQIIQWDAGVGVDYHSGLTESTWIHINQGKFYPNGPIKEAFWSTISSKFLKVIDDYHQAK